MIYIKEHFIIKPVSWHSYIERLNDLKTLYPKTQQDLMLILILKRWNTSKQKMI